VEGVFPVTVERQAVLIVCEEHPPKPTLRIGIVRAVGELEVSLTGAACRATFTFRRRLLVASQLAIRAMLHITC